MLKTSLPSILNKVTAFPHAWVAIAFLIIIPSHMVIDFPLPEPDYL